MSKSGSYFAIFCHSGPFSDRPLCVALQVVVPPKELVLAGKDAAAEYDELAEPQDFQDDPE